MIKKHLFKEAYISFLLQGHTHSDWDQIFSTWVNQILRLGLTVHSKEKISQFIDQAYKGNKPVYHPIQEGDILDFDSWFEGYFAILEGISGPHAFKMVLAADEKTVCTAK